MFKSDVNVRLQTAVQENIQAESQDLKEKLLRAGLAEPEMCCLTLVTSLPAVPVRTNPTAGMQHIYTQFCF